MESKATFEEKHRLLTRVLDAVYVDLLATRSIVGLLPKPAFYSLLESLKQRPNSNVTVFNPLETDELGQGDQKENAPVASGREMGFGGGGGESNSPSKRSDPEYPTSLVSSLVSPN